jgi:hypothetical protein
MSRTCENLEPLPFFPIFSCWPQENLAKSGCKTNREVENIGILLHVGELLEHIT